MGSQADCLAKAASVCGGSYEVLSNASNTRGWPGGNNNMLGTPQEMLVSCGSRQPSSSPRPERSTYATSEPPGGAGGFVFGATIEVVQQRCEGAGLQWRSKDDRAVCSALVEGVGYPGRVRMTFCFGKVCQVRLALRLVQEGENEAIVDEYVKLHNRLSKKYGEPQHAALRASPDCQHNLHPCLVDKDANLRSEWQWSSGQRLVMSLVADDADVVVWLHYFAKDATTPDSAL